MLQSLLQKSQLGSQIVMFPPSRTQHLVHNSDIEVDAVKFNGLTWMPTLVPASTSMLTSTSTLIKKFLTATEAAFSVGIQTCVSVPETAISALQFQAKQPFRPPRNSSWQQKR